METKVIVAVVVLATILVGITVFLIRLELKVKKLEKEIKGLL